MSAGAGDWETLLERRPAVMWGLVADLVKAAKAEESGQRIGRRPTVVLDSIDELYDVLFPPRECAESPFGIALSRRLVATRQTQRSFAISSGMPQTRISRICGGTVAPTADLIEQVATALKVSPNYFMEYRALKIAQVVESHLIANPARSVAMIRELMH